MSLFCTLFKPTCLKSPTWFDLNQDFFGNYLFFDTLWLNLVIRKMTEWFWKKVENELGELWGRIQFRFFFRTPNQAPPLRMPKNLRKRSTAWCTVTSVTSGPPETRRSQKVKSNSGISDIRGDNRWVTIDWARPSSGPRSRAWFKYDLTWCKYDLTWLKYDVTWFKDYSIWFKYDLTECKYDLTRCTYDSTYFKYDLTWYK